MSETEKPKSQISQVVIKLIEQEDGIREAARVIGEDHTKLIRYRDGATRLGEDLLQLLEKIRKTLKPRMSRHSFYKTLVGESGENDD